MGSFHGTDEQRITVLEDLIRRIQQIGMEARRMELEGLRPTKLIYNVIAEIKTMRTLNVFALARNEIETIITRLTFMAEDAEAEVRNLKGETVL